jgi:hypothetical protein
MHGADSVYKHVFVQACVTDIARFAHTYTLDSKEGYT